MDDGVDAVDGAGDGRSVGQRPLDEVVGNAGEVGAAADGQVVEDSDAVLSLDQEPGQGRTDEAGPAGDEDRPVQRRCAPPAGTLSARASGTQRTFWTKVVGSIRSR
jgi:hypothetical protein